MMMMMIGMIVGDKIFQAPAGSSAHSFNPPPLLGDLGQARSRDLAVKRRRQLQRRVNNDGCMLRL